VSKSNLNQEDLNDFFSLIGNAKKEKKEKMEELVSNSFEDYFWEELKKETEPKKKNKKNIKSSDISLIGRGESPTNNFIQSTHVSTSLGESVDSLMEKSLGLLSEPSNIKQQNDPLTPLNQNFATLEDLQKHYSLFLSRIQQQLSTLGGGGETNLTFMDVPITSVTTSSYTVKPQDYYIGVNYAGAVTITLPNADREGKIFVIKDELGEASKGTNRYITVLPTGSDLIDGRDRAILAYDYGSLTFIWKSNSWRVI
jgi:hypothetical protein